MEQPQPQRAFFARTYGFGARTGTVFGVLALLLAVLVYLVTPGHQLSYRALLIGGLVYAFTRRHTWPTLIVASDAIEVNASILTKRYRRLTPADIAHMEMTDTIATITPTTGNPIIIKRKGFRVPVREALWEALRDFPLPTHS